ncbi:MAG: alanine racemase, partial [Muribaculaceae bacterium]|nr:alanine racemase [Muribaculaceae bacterium]
DLYKAMTTSDFASELVLIKGTPAETFDNFARQLEARTHETVLEVNLDAMVHNYNFFRSRLHHSTGIVAMVKASGYGAGSYELAKSLQAHGAAYLAVAVLDEGVELRQAGITMPIMVLNPKVLNYPQLFAYRLEPEVFDFDILNEIIEAGRRVGVKDYPVHLKLDTGMHRLGFCEDDIDRIIKIVRNQDVIRICSVFSHLATADCLDMDLYTRAQLELFDRCSQRVVEAFPYRVMRHILNTAGILRFPEYQYDLVRLGIGLYGIPILNNGMEEGLRPVSTLRSVIIALKKYPAGTAIGYGRRGLILKDDTVVATVPVGYADGVDRHLGCGRCAFVVGGVKCPTVGIICMDVCMIDVSAVPAVSVGDSVEIFGPENPVTELSRLLDTIPYELLTSVSPRVRRLYYRES